MDLILYNGIIKILDSADTTAMAVGIKGNKIVCFGDTSDVIKSKTINTELIDLNGKLVLPGFNDSHIHLLGCGYSKDD